MSFIKHTVKPTLLAWHLSARLCPQWLLVRPLKLLLTRPSRQWSLPKTKK